MNGMGIEDSDETFREIQKLISAVGISALSDAVRKVKSIV